MSFETISLDKVLGERGYIRGPFGSALRRPEMKTEGIPVYEQQNAIYNNREFRFFIDEKKYEELKRFTVQPGDLVVSCSGTLGKITIIKEGDPLGIISQALLILRPDLNQIKPEFLYYFLTSPEGQYLLLGASHGSVQTNIAKREVVTSIKIPNIPQREQENIVKIFSDLDHKIEVNRRINETLELISQSLFKKYFVDNPESESWATKPLDEIADFKNGLACQKYPAQQEGSSQKVIKIKEMTSGFTDKSDVVGSGFPAEYIIENGDMLFAWSGTLMTKIWTDGPGALNQHIFKVTSEEYPKWFYYQWVNEHLKRFVMIAKSKAVTMGHIKRSHLSEVNVKVPPKEYMESFDELFSSLLEKQISAAVENSTLTSLRDSLLPKLMSGEIKI